MDSNLADAINVVMRLLYGGPALEVSREQIIQLQSTFPSDLVEHAIETMRRSDLGVPSWLEGTLKRTGPGVRAYATHTALALALGRDYIVQSAISSTVHIVVKGVHKPEVGGTGFYCSDAGNRLITASHVVDRDILRIEDSRGNILHRPPITIRAHIPSLDLAIIDVVAPGSTPSLTMEWDKEEVVLLSPVYVMGFPQIPQQTLSIVARAGEVASISVDFNKRTSYLTTQVTSAGFSGGPALNKRGRVIGVVEGKPHDPSSTSPEPSSTDDLILDSQLYDPAYSVLTPGWYIDELLRGM